MLREIAKTTKCHIQIEKKSGIPFLLYKYKKRKIFFFFLLFMITCIMITSHFIWNVEITGENHLNKEEILQDLKENGLMVGKWKNSIDTQKIINDMRLKRNDIAWIGISLKGTNAIVEIVEADKKPEIVDELDYCNIVSDKTGVITKINSQNGTNLVKEGDVVQKGTVLIGGWLEGKYTGTRYVHAKGEIEAKVWYSKKEKIYLNQDIRVKTGKEEKKYGIKINNFQINLYKTLSKFKNYDTINTSKKLKLFSNFYLPIEIIENTNQEVEIQAKEYTVEEAKQLTEQRIGADLEKEIEQVENIVNKQVNFYEKEGYIEVEVIYEVLEKIGTNEKIVF